MIDVWKIISLIFPFIEIMIHSILHILKQRKKKNDKIAKVLPLEGITESEFVTSTRERKIENFVQNLARYGLPLAYTLFVICYFLYGSLY